MAIYSPTQHTLCVLMIMLKIVNGSLPAVLESSDLIFIASDFHFGKMINSRVLEYGGLMFMASDFHNPGNQLI